MPSKARAASRSKATASWRLPSVCDARSPSGMSRRMNPSMSASATGHPISAPCSASGRPVPSPCRSMPWLRRRPSRGCNAYPARDFCSTATGSTRSAKTPPPDRALLRDAALVIFTSGSTGDPKGVVIGHRRLADKLAVLDRLLNIAPNDVVLSPLQLVFIFGLWVSLLTLMKGARLILVPKFTEEAMARGLAEATVLAGVPSMFRTLLTYPRITVPQSRRQNCGRCSAAARCWRRRWRTPWRGFAPAAIHDLYGLTETGSCDFHLGPAGQPQGFGTIGHPTERRHVPDRQRRRRRRGRRNR